ncbi:hypothetical protein [Acidiphilium angustum]|uniref:hypothetical protein n=1 Tax=Acidiphilium angustum TaxID=523 RepID=UPI0004949888|nr:hypothetical protein [Acidiphilium angustum]
MGIATRDWSTFDPIIIARTVEGHRSCDIADDLGLPHYAVSNRRAHLRAMKRLPKHSASAPVETGPSPRVRAMAEIGFWTALPPFHPIAAEVLGWKPGASP